MSHPIDIQNAISMLHAEGYTITSPVSEPINKTITVSGLIGITPHYTHYQFSPSAPIDLVKYKSKIEQAIKEVVNGWDEHTVKVTKEHWKELHQLLDKYEKDMDAIIQKKVYECYESIWNEARATHPLAGMKYDTFQDFKNTQPQPKEQPDNTKPFVWTDDLVREFADNVPVDEMANSIHIQKFKQSKSPTSTSAEWEIVAYESCNFIFKLKNGRYEYADFYLEDKESVNAKINSVKRISDGTIFTVGDDTDKGKVIRIEKSDTTNFGFSFYMEGQYNPAIPFFAHEFNSPQPTDVQPNKEDNQVTDNTDVACLSLNDVMEIVRNIHDGTTGHDNRNYINSMLHEKVKEKIKL